MTSDALLSFGTRALDGRVTNSTTPSLDEARELLRRSPAVDLHTDTLAAAVDGADLLAEPSTQADPLRLVDGGFGDVIYAAWIPPHLGPVGGWELVERFMAALDDLRSRVRAAELPLRTWSALEDARSLAAGPSRVDRLARWGVRYVTLTWNNGNRFATSCEDTRTGGLTAAGRELVAALDDRGIVVDVSHASDATIDDVLAAAKRPPIASHSSSRALRRHPRNVSDRHARAIADRGGVIGVNVFPFFIDDVYGSAAVDDVAAHVEHLWDVAGEDAVAFGSDFDGIPDPPRELVDASEFPRLIACLLDRGHAATRIEKFARTNAVRALTLGEPS